MPLSTSDSARRRRDSVRQRKMAAILKPVLKLIAGRPPSILLLIAATTTPLYHQRNDRSRASEVSGKDQKLRRRSSLWMRGWRRLDDDAAGAAMVEYGGICRRFECEVGFVRLQFLAFQSQKAKKCKPIFLKLINFFINKCF